MLRLILIFGSLVLLMGCSSIQTVGMIGPKKLNVIAIASSDFLSANRTLVILDDKGNVVAYTGGTVTGPGTVGIQAAGTIATAGAILYGAKAVQHGLENAQVKGIPSDITVNTDSIIEVGKKPES